MDRIELERRIGETIGHFTIPDSYRVKQIADLIYLLFREFADEITDEAWIASVREAGGTKAWINKKVELLKR